MPYLIDTDWVIDHLAENPEATRLLDQFTSEGLAISVATYMEVLEGVYSSAEPAEASSRFEDFLASVPVIRFDEDIARTCALLRHRLRRNQRRVNSRMMDLIIAATAMTEGLTLVTRNIHDYVDLPGLQIYASNSHES